MGTASTANWTALRIEYINGSMSLRALANNHNLKTASGIFTRASKEGWDAQRKQQQAKTSKAAQDILDETKPNELAEFNKNDLVIAKTIRFQIASAIKAASDSKAQLTPAALRLLASAAESSQRIGRLALGVTTGNTGISQPDGSPLLPSQSLLEGVDLAKLTIPELEQLESHFAAIERFRDSQAGTGGQKP